MTEQNPIDPALQQAQGEVQKLRLVLDNVMRKGAQKDVYIAELEIDNQIMMQQLQQLQAQAGAFPQPNAVPEQGQAEGGGEEVQVEEASNVVEGPWPGSGADESAPEPDPFPDPDRPA